MIPEVLREQEGVLTMAQALASGVTESKIRANLIAGRWQRVRRGVYVTFTGPVPRRCQLWAAVLAAGQDAVLSHDSVTELAGLTAPAGVIHVTVPEGRKATHLDGVVLHRSRHLATARHPVLRPPQTRFEEAIVDLTQIAHTLRDAYGWLAKAVNSGMTTTERLLAAIAARPRVRWRRLLREALGDVAAGCRSVLELAYLRDVEQRHGLPAGERQSPVAGGRGRIYVDVRYRCFGVRVELDGRAAHPPEHRFRDMARDNDAVVAGERPLRYGTPDVRETPCAVAGQVVAVLRRAGWSGMPRRCGRTGCSIS